MLVRIKYLIITLSIFTLLLSPITARAEVLHQPASQVTVYDLIDAVNALRLSYGLNPYTVNSILMFTAQNQADFMASIGQTTHSGPGGITLTQRLLAAGYPLAGDLSLGGFRAENITSGNLDKTAEDAVSGWMGDAPHQNTMLSPNLTEIGAGVAMANGRVYLVIDCALPTNAPILPSAGTLVVSGGTSVPAAGEAPMMPVVLSTPNPDGQVIHEVKYGQTLWQLAISYGVKIDEIKSLNNLFDNSIYPGNKLLIKIELTPTLAPATVTLMPSMTVAPTHTLTLTLTPIASSTSIALPIQTQTQSQPGGNKTVWFIAIIALAILGASIFARLDSKP